MSDVIGLDNDDTLDPFTQHISPFSPSLQSRLSALANDEAPTGTQLDFGRVAQDDDMWTQLEVLEAELEESRANERVALGELTQVRRDYARLVDQHATLQGEAAAEAQVLRQQLAQLALAADAERVALLSRLDRSEHQIASLEADKTMLGGMVDDLQGEVERLSAEAARLASLGAGDTVPFVARS